jgi:hypothetical protein
MSHQPLDPARCPACGECVLPPQTHCPKCQAPLPGLDSKGETFAVLADVELVPDAAPRKRKRRRKPPTAGLTTVRVGLGYQSARQALTLLVYVVAMGNWPAFCLPLHPWCIAAGVWTMGGLGLLAALVGMVGSILCLAVGRASGAWLFILVSLALDVLSLGLIVFLHVAGGPPLVAGVVEIVAWVFFMLFLHRLAVDLDQPKEAGEVLGLLKRGLILFILVPLLLGALAFLAVLYSAFSTGLAHLLIAVSAVILLVQFAFLVLLFLGIIGVIQNIRDAIATRLRRLRRREKEDYPD